MTSAVMISIIPCSCFGLLTSLCGVRMQAAPDPMHTMPLGVSRHLIQATVWVISTYLSSLHKVPNNKDDQPTESFFDTTHVQKVVTRMCTRFHIIMRTCHGLDLTRWMCQELQRVYTALCAKEPSMKASLRAHEYLIVSMLMPYVLTEILREELVEYCQYLDQHSEGVDVSKEFLQQAVAKVGSDPVPAMVATWHMYMEFFCALRQTRMSESQLVQLQIQCQELQKQIWKAYPHKAGSKHRWNFIKFHHMLSFACTFRLFGSLDGVSTQSTEHTHTFYSGKLFTLTNGKGDVGQQITDRLSVMQAILDLATVFTSEFGLSLERTFRKYTPSKSQIYCFPVQRLLMEHLQVTRKLRSPLTIKDTRTRIRHTSLGTWAAHRKTSPTAGPVLAAPDWPKAFAYLPYLLGPYLWKYWRQRLDMPEWDNVSHITCMTCAVLCS